MEPLLTKVALAMPTPQRPSMVMPDSIVSVCPPNSCRSTLAGKVWAPEETPDRAAERAELLSFGEIVRQLGRSENAAQLLHTRVLLQLSQMLRN